MLNSTRIINLVLIIHVEFNESYLFKYIYRPYFSHLKILVAILKEYKKDRNTTCSEKVHFKTSHFREFKTTKQLEAPIIFLEERSWNCI